MGITDYLKGNNEIENLLVTCGKISFLQAGQKRGHMSALLDDKKMEKLMVQLRQRFDYVIIDTPPAYLFYDAAMLSVYGTCYLYGAS